MATLILRENTWHLKWYWRGKPKWRSTKIPHDGKFKNGKPVPPAAAKRELGRLEYDLDSGRNTERKTIAQLLDLVEDEYQNSNNGQGYRSKGACRSRLKHLREFFYNMPAHQVNEIEFREYAEWRRKARQDRDRKWIWPAKDSTIHRELELVMKALRIGKMYPLPILPKLKETPPRKGFFDDAMISAVIRRLPIYLQAPAWFGYYTGWRREEVFSLQWSNVDFKASEVRLWFSKNDT